MLGNIKTKKQKENNKIKTEGSKSLMHENNSCYNHVVFHYIVKFILSVTMKTSELLVAFCDKSNELDAPYNAS